MPVPAGYEPTALSIGRGAFNTSTRAQLVDMVPGISVLGVAIVAPAITSKTLAELSVTVPAGTKRITMYASAAGITWNYNAAATAGTLAVSASPTIIDINATDLALLQFLGDATKTLNLIFQG